MAQPALRPPPSLQPRPKAVPTFSNAAIGGKATPATSQLSKPPTQSRQPSPSLPTGTTDVSDKATIALVKRVLCPNSHAQEPRPLNELLPPLTSSNEVDLQLYAIIAIIVKDLVYSWYGKITPDQTFVEEVIRIIAHCTTQLESRLRTLDLESLILDEIPGLVERHVNAYRISHPQVHPASFSTNPQQMYHSLNPHPALFPVPDHAAPKTIDEQSKNEADYRQLLVQGALAVLLPTEDLENGCLRTLVADVMAESVLGNAIGGKVSESWFLWSSIHKLVDVVKAKVRPRATGEAIQEDTRGRLEKFGLLSEKAEKQQTGKHQPGRRSAVSTWFWMGLQYIFLTAIAIRFVVVGFFLAKEQPLRSSSVPRATALLDASPIETPLQSSPPRPPSYRPILTFQIFSLLSTLLDLPSRTPWLAGSLALLQHHLIHGPLTVGATDGILDQYIHTLFVTNLSPSALVPQALALLRQNIFPANTLPPPTTLSPPTPEQKLQIRRSCAEALLSLLPARVSNHYLGSTDDDDEGDELQGAASSSSAAKDIETELDIWSDSYCNKHVMYSLVELVVVRVIPEMGRKGVSELVGERLGSGGGVEGGSGNGISVGNAV